MPDETCPPEEELRDGLVGKLPVEVAEALLDHVDGCPHCQAKLQTVSDADDTLIEYLRQPPVRDEVEDEPQFREAVARAKAISDTPATRGQAGGTGEPKPDIVGELGEYQILEKLAEGGMGTVYKALHTKLGREVALKVLPPGGLGSERAVARFEREMKAVGQLDHPNIVRALDAREVEGTRFLVLEYIDGVDLSRLVRRRGPRPVAEACQLVRQAAVGLKHAHEHDLIHRDVKPSNLMVDQEGQLKILDLGLARFRAGESSGDEMTRTGQTMGTAEYMAPEQASDTRSVDVRADIYGLGCTLHYLLVGRAPYTGETAYQILTAHHESPIPSLCDERHDVPERLDRLFRKMVAKTPGERHASMTEVIADLEECLAEAEALERTTDFSEAPSAAPQPKRKKRRVAAALLVGAVTAMALLAGLMITLKTRQGTLIIRVDQQDAKVVIDDGKITITTRDDEQPVEVRLQKGKHTFTVSKGGFQTETGRFTITSGKREIVEVELIPLSAATPTLAVAPFDSRQAARHQTDWAEYLEVPVEQTNSIGMKLVLIPPGEFDMGSSEEEIQPLIEEAKRLKWSDKMVDPLKAECPKHRVEITRPFYIGKHEVTVGQFREFVTATGFTTDAERLGRGVSLGEYLGDMEFDPERNWRNTGLEQTDDHPVVDVSWWDATEFCKWLSQKEGREYRLPREAEWEYACRAGTTTRYTFGDGSKDMSLYAWWAENSGWTTHPVGLLKSNPWGLHDMYGNVGEWCWDAFEEYPLPDDQKSAPQEPGRSDTTDRSLVVARGGGKGFLLPTGGSPCRCPGNWRSSIHGTGFRVVCDPVGYTDPRVPTEPPARPTQPQIAAAGLVDPDRRATEWVLSIGGSVRFFVRDEKDSAQRTISEIAELPEKDFSITNVYLQENRLVTDADLAGLTELRTLGGLYLDDCEGITDLALEYVEQFETRTTMRLNLNGTQVSGDGLARLERRAFWGQSYIRH